jgi:hypothetical protein
MMKRLIAFAAVFAVAFSFGLGLTVFTPEGVMAKPPIICKLMLEPFYVCNPAPQCHDPGEELCYLCLGRDLQGEPCLCSKVGCMIPPQ